MFGDLVTGRFFTKLDGMTDANKGVNPLHFGINPDQFGKS